jgi:hypothetical protein
VIAPYSLPDACLGFTNPQHVSIEHYYEMQENVPRSHWFGARQFTSTHAAIHKAIVEPWYLPISRLGFEDEAVLKPTKTKLSKFRLQISQQPTATLSRKILFAQHAEWDWDRIDLTMKPDQLICQRYILANELE